MFKDIDGQSDNNFQFKFKQPWQLIQKKSKPTLKIFQQRFFENEKYLVSKLLYREEIERIKLTNMGVKYTIIPKMVDSRMRDFEVSKKLLLEDIDLEKWCAEVRMMESQDYWFVVCLNLQAEYEVYAINRYFQTKFAKIHTTSYCSLTKNYVQNDVYVYFYRNMMVINCYQSVNTIRLNPGHIKISQVKTQQDMFEQNLNLCKSPKGYFVCFIVSFVF